MRGPQQFTSLDKCRFGVEFFLIMCDRLNLYLFDKKVLTERNLWDLIFGPPI